MRLKRWALVAEIVGSVAVVVTLAILILEVRENTEESRATNRQSVIDDLREQLLVRAQSASLADALAAAEAGQQLTPAQSSQYIGYLMAVIKSVEEAYFQYAEGRLDRAYLDTRIAGLLNDNFLGNELGRAFFVDNADRGEITPEFAQVVYDRIAEMNAERASVQ
jgi:hypothetical protein